MFSKTCNKVRFVHLLFLNWANMRYFIFTICKISLTAIARLKIEVTKTSFLNGWPLKGLLYYFRYFYLSIKLWYEQELQSWICKQTSCKVYGYITQEFKRLRLWNFQGTIFIWTQTYTEIFKFALVYLWDRCCHCGANHGKKKDAEQVELFKVVQYARHTGMQRKKFWNTIHSKTNWWKS